MADIQSLDRGSLHRFANWPNEVIPRVAAGVYTVWQGDRFLYVGMAGRKLSAEDIREARAIGEKKRRGLADRLTSHASGRRSGDQFCVYICDRLVLPTLTQGQLHQVGSAELLLDELTKHYIRSNLSCRFIETASGKEAFAVERDVQAGALAAGRPFLNPA